MNIIFRYIHFNKTKLLLIAASLLVRLFLSPSFANAFEVLVVKDSNIKPYLDAVAGFKSSCSCTVKEVALSDIDALEKAVRAHPDAVVAVGTESFRKVRRIKSIPVVYTMVVPSEAEDISADNLSGVSMAFTAGDYFNAIAEAFPAAKRVGVLFDPARTGALVREASRAAGKKGLTLVTAEVSDPRRLPELLNEIRGKIDLLWLPPDPTFSNSASIEHLMLFAFQNKLPIFSFSKKIVSLGAVAALSVDPRNMGAQAGEMARCLLQGEQGPFLEHPKRPRLIVNRKIAEKIGVAINDEAMRHAETVE